MPTRKRLSDTERREIAAAINGKKHTPISELKERYGVSDATLYSVAKKARFGGRGNGARRRGVRRNGSPGNGQDARIRQLEQENERLRRMYMDLLLTIESDR